MSKSNSFENLNNTMFDILLDDKNIPFDEKIEISSEFARQFENDPDFSEED